MLDPFEKAAAWDKPESELDFDQSLYIKDPASYDEQFADCVDLEKLGRTQHMGAWADVEAKAKRIAAGGVTIMHKRPYDLYKPAEIIETKAKVRGDHGTYESTIHQPHPRSRAIRWWDCQCTWRRYVWNRSPGYKQFEGRVCSHVLALWWYSAGLPVSYEDVPPEILNRNIDSLVEQGRLFDTDLKALEENGYDVSGQEAQVERSQEEQRIKAIEDKIEELGDEAFDLRNELKNLEELYPDKLKRTNRRKEIKDRIKEIYKEQFELRAEIDAIQNAITQRSQRPDESGIYDAQNRIREIEEEISQAERELADIESQISELDPEDDDNRGKLETKKRLKEFDIRDLERERVQQEARLDAMGESINFALQQPLPFDSPYDSPQLMNIVESLGSGRPFAGLGFKNYRLETFDGFFDLMPKYEEWDENDFEPTAYMEIAANRLIRSGEEEKTKQGYALQALQLMIENSEEILECLEDIRRRRQAIDNMKRRRQQIDYYGIIRNPGERYVPEGESKANVIWSLEQEIEERRNRVQDLLRAAAENAFGHLDKDYYKRQWDTPYYLPTDEVIRGEVPRPSRVEIVQLRKGAPQLFDWMRVNVPKSGPLRRRYNSLYQAYNATEDDEGGKRTRRQRDNALKDLYRLKAEIESQEGFSPVRVRRVKPTAPKIEPEQPKEVEEEEMPEEQQQLFQSSVSKTAGVSLLSFDMPINDITIYVQAELAKGKNPKAYVRRNVTGEQRGGLHPHPDAMPIRMREDGSAIYSVDDLGYNPESGQMGYNVEERHNYGIIPVGGEVDVLAVDPTDRMMLVVHRLDEVAPNHTHIQVWLPIKDIDLI